uniref:FHA domain-containing protein n=1 Tax=Pelusios castaneus TaxID=367368 RepID=A0A8C8S2J4_9SAUR
MEQTQLLQWDEDGDPPRVEATNEAPRPVGRLHLLSSKYGPEQDFWIYPGENVVGRLQSCRVCLPAPSVSKAHAVIEDPTRPLTLGAVPMRHSPPPLQLWCLKGRDGPGWGPSGTPGFFPQLWEGSGV